MKLLVRRERILNIMKKLLVVVFLVAMVWGIEGYKRREDKTKCPHVKAIRNFDIHELLGPWYVVQYYASSEEALAYRCMRTLFNLTNGPAGDLEVNMNFTYSFTDDPINEQLLGNITWIIPSKEKLAHWVHAEETYEGIYNTYVLDSDYSSWALLLHCAEKNKSPRYLSSFIMSRSQELGPNVVSYLRDKLPRYDIDLGFMFPMSQQGCDTPVAGAPPGLVPGRKATRRHPMKRIHRRRKEMAIFAPTSTTEVIYF